MTGGDRRAQRQIFKQEVSARLKRNHNDPFELMVDLDFGALRAAEAPESFLCDLGDLVVQKGQSLRVSVFHKRPQRQKFEQKATKITKKRKIGRDGEQTAGYSWESDPFELMVDLDFGALRAAEARPCDLVVRKVRLCELLFVCH
jgi:hypothetical protein